MITIRRTVESDVARYVVACYLTDFTSTADWDPHTRACRQLDPGIVEIGTRYANTQRIGPLRTTMHYRVTDLVQDRKISLRSSTSRLDATDEMTFDDAANGGTRVTYTASFSLKGAARAIEPLLRRVLDKIGDDGARGMRRSLARLTTPPPPGYVAWHPS